MSASAQDPTGEPRSTGARGQARTVELSRAEQTLGRRAAESRATIPDLTLCASVDMGACAALRAQAGRPTYTDMVVRACALALREQPRANSSYRDGRVLVHARVNIAVTVPEATQAPTIFDADSKTLPEIAGERAALARAARAGALAPPQLAGATFTVADLGHHRLESFTAAVSPGQAGVLALGAVAPRAVVFAGVLSARATLITTLACDQRILDREPAAAFLARIRELLEAAPATLV